MNEKNRNSTATALGIICLLLLVLDLYKSIFVKALDVIKSLIFTYYENIEYYVVDDITDLISFALFLLIAFYSLVMIVRVLKRNNQFSKKWASVLLYQKNVDMRRFFDEKGNSKLQIYITAIFTVLCVIIITKPIILNINNLYDIKFINDFKFCIFALIVLIFIKAFIQTIIDCVEIKSFSRSNPEILIEFDCDEYPLLQSIKIQPENHFVLIKKYRNHNNLWSILHKDTCVLSNQRISIYNVHKCNVMSFEKIYSVSSGSQAIIEFKLKIDFDIIKKKSESIKNSICFAEKGKLDALILNFKKFISDLDLDLSVVFQKDVNDLKVQSLNILSIENLDSIDPTEILKSFEKYQYNLIELNELCLRIPVVISDELNEFLMLEIKNHFPVLHQFIELNAFVKKLDLVNEIQRKIDKRNDFFQEIFMKLVDYKTSLHENARNDYIEKIELILKSNDLLPNDLLDYIDNQKKDKNKEKNESTNEVNIEAESFAGAVFKAIKKGKQELDLEHPKEKDELLNFTFKILKEIPSSKQILFEMKQHIFEKFIQEFLNWEIESNEKILFDMISDFVKTYVDDANDK